MWGETLFHFSFSIFHLAFFIEENQSMTNIKWKMENGKSRCYNPTSILNQDAILNMRKTMQPLVGLIMGSKSDWETMSHAAQTLETLGVPFEVRVLSAHRTPDQLFEYVESAEGRGLEVIIAAAGGAAHLAGVAAAKTLLPVLGVPMESKSLKGLDSLLSMVQMPAGIPVGTLAIGRAGAVNAALFAAAILGIKRPEVREEIKKYRENQAREILAHPDPREP
jgi:5-(carboxyamino)imidazole ribonucleotide mutase